MIKRKLYSIIKDTVPVNIGCMHPKHCQESTKLDCRVQGVIAYK